jgi:hypothetical protein
MFRTKQHLLGHAVVEEHLMRMLGLFARGLAAAFVAAVLWGPLGGSGASAQAPPPCDPSLPCRLSVNLPEFPGAVIDFQFAPNSERVVFIHVGDGAVRQLYSAPVVGGESPTKLNVPAVDQIHDVAISPDSTRVVYSASEPESPERHLFSVPITGPTSANVRLASNVAVSRAQISPDSRKVVFQPATGERLHAAPIAGPANASVRLTAPVVAGGSNGVLPLLSTKQSLAVWRGNKLHRGR